MQIPILIEPIAGSGFCARSGEPLPLTANGTTRDEALANLRKKLHSKLQNGSEMVTLWVGSLPQAGQRATGIFADEAQYEEFRTILEENRSKEDKEEVANQ